MWEWFILYGTIDPNATAAAMNERDRIIDHVAGRTNEWDVLLCPSMRTATRTMAEGAAQPRIERMGNFSLWDVTGQPSLSVPFGTADNGMPLGLLITGQMGADDVVLQRLAGARAVLEARGWCLV